MKRFKSKKGFKKRNIFKLMIILFIVYFSFSFSIKYLMKNKIKDKVTNQVLINYLLKAGSNNTIDLNDNNSLFNINVNTSNLLLKTSLNNMVSESNILFKDNYDENTIVTKYFEDPNNYTVNRPLIYIYNTHQLEEYSNSNVSMYDASPNVLMASYILKEKLNDIGLPTIVEETNISQLLQANNWNYNYSYKASRMLVKSAMEQNSTLMYFIDLHRDSLPKDRSTLTIDNKSYAKVLFVIGTDHSNYQQNLVFANRLNEIINSKVDNLSKGVLEKGGEGVNGIYNQDLNNNLILIEIGGPENTIDEVTNTINVIASALYDYIKG